MIINNINNLINESGLGDISVARSNQGSIAGGPGADTIYVNKILRSMKVKKDGVSNIKKKEIKGISFIK